MAAAVAVAVAAAVVVVAVQLWKVQVFKYFVFQLVLSGCHGSAHIMLHGSGFRVEVWIQASSCLKPSLWTLTAYTAKSRVT